MSTTILLEKLNDFDYIVMNNKEGLRIYYYSEYFEDYKILLKYFEEFYNGDNKDKILSYFKKVMERFNEIFEIEGSECETCFGNGFDFCFECRGSGFVYTDDEPCDECGGTGGDECSGCYGTGKIDYDDWDIKSIRDLNNEYKNTISKLLNLSSKKL